MANKSNKNESTHGKNGGNPTRSPERPPPQEDNVFGIAHDVLGEEQPDWLILADQYLALLDGSQHEIMKKRTILGLLAAEFTGSPKSDVYARPGIVSPQTLSGKWMKDPVFAEVIGNLRRIMVTEIEHAELTNMRRALAISRISTSKAAEVRAELLDHHSPWVRLQAARDIMTTALNTTDNISGREVDAEFNAKVSSAELEQLLSIARSELNTFIDSIGDGDALPDGRPLVIESGPAHESEQVIDDI